jgi:phosphohistidine phosphatase
MELILWRHADAEDPIAQDDFARELTKKGHRQARAMADWLRPRLEGEWRVLTSPAARAVQTVTPLERDYEIRPNLDPTRVVGHYLRESGWPTGPNTILVGHQPTLGEVVARLVQDQGGDVAVKKGAIWWFATRERGGQVETVVKAVMDPSMLDVH